MKYPKILYVQIDPNSDPKDDSFLVYQNEENIDDGKVAIYGFKKMVNKRTETIIE